MNNYKIFEYLKESNNDKIHRLSKSSILQLINYINKYYLELRQDISININNIWL